MYIELCTYMYSETEKIQYLNSKCVHWDENIPSYIIPNMVKCSGCIYVAGCKPSEGDSRSESGNCWRSDLARARAYHRWGGSVKSASCQWVISNFFFEMRSRCEQCNGLWGTVHWRSRQLERCHFLFIFFLIATFRLLYVYIYIVYMWRFSKAVISEILGITKMFSMYCLNKLI